MRNVKVLQMLEDGKIDELKAELRDEIYKDSLKQKPDVKRLQINKERGGSQDSVT